jgi:glyoxylase-like metal-dependent hydrolase (beta-lactamase superfamily II)
MGYCSCHGRFKRAPPRRKTNMTGQTVAPPLSYPFEIPPDSGTVLPVAPGILWLRLPLPLALNHINVWLLEDEAGWTVVDTGFGTRSTQELWERVIARDLSGKPVIRVIGTHFHPDHVGLAGWMVERWHAEFHMSLTEWLFGRMLCLDPAEAVARTNGEFYHRAGVGADLLAALVSRGNAYARSVMPLPSSVMRLRAGDRLRIGGRDWNIIIGSGHTPEHVCLYCPELSVLISGDQVLPRISPNVSVWPSEPDADPLNDFLETLNRLRTLPADILVLPSHDQPFRGLTVRIDELARHHDERLAEAWEACAEPASAEQIARIMFRRDLDPHQTVFAIGEALAHLNHLVGLGRLRRQLQADGIMRFTQV